MSKPAIILIAALGADTRAIGKDGKLLWHLPNDLKRFKELTMGHPIIMGRTTYESIGRPLPGRTNIVLCGDASFAPEGVTVCRTLDEAFDTAATLDDDEVFVIGGGSVYAQTIELADTLYLTLVYDDALGDVFFPEYAHLPFSEMVREEHEHEGLHYAYVTMERCE
jgi:dihydrofolate reductase